MKDLLQLLENDSTLSHAQLAAMTGSTEGEVAAAVAQYEKDHVILGYKTIIDWDRTQQESVTQFVGEKLAPIEGVTGTATHFILKKYKEKHLIFPVQEVQEERFVFE